MNNNKEAIIVGIQKASDEYKLWLGQAELLIKGKANHIVKSPKFYTDCGFGSWLYSDGQQLSSLPGFKDVESAHQSFHQAYKSLYEGAKEVSDSESISELKRYFSTLEGQSDISIKQLEQIEQFLLNEDNDSHVLVEEKIVVDEMIDIEPERVIESERSSVQEFSLSSEELRRQLKEQDLLQLKQEQELTELELKQLEDRQQLTIQSTEQIEQYLSLKEQEISLQLDDHKALEDANINNIFLGQQDISRLKEEILSKQGELEQLALVDQKLEQRKEEEERKERKILNEFESRQALDKQDLLQLNQQRKKWESEAERLRQQLMLIEQDLEGLTEKELQKQSLIDKSDCEKEVKLQELVQQSRLQDKLNGHKARVKETKQAELKELEDTESSKKRRLKELELESAMLENQKIDISKQHRNEIRELDERQRFKKLTIEKLERDKARKEQELKELIHQQSVIKQSLESVELSKNDNEKELEEA